MELTVQNVYGLLLRSKLLSVEEARAMYARWQEESKQHANNLAKFAGWMVANKYVTEYQASLLARGYAEGFYLNEYKILDRIGKGRMAGVYRAQHRLGQIVAIKVLPPSKTREPMVLARFQRESRLAIRLKHPNIVRGFQTGVCGNLHYLVMEHLEGTTLEELLVNRTRLSPGEAVRIIHQALTGLQHIHEQGLVHRDLKPANLMLTPSPLQGSTLDCTVKILDIGLGRALFEEGTEPQDTELTAEGVLLGTPDYMAPEQARDPRDTDIRADVYSLGCVLYHCLTGQPPFPDTNIISQMIRHASEVPRPLRDFNPAIPEGLQQILSWMMAKQPSERYPTPERAARALEVFLVAGGSLSSPDLDPQMTPYLDWLEDEKRKESVRNGESAANENLEETATFTAIPALKPPSGSLPAVAPPATTASTGKAASKSISLEERSVSEGKAGKSRKKTPPSTSGTEKGSTVGREESPATRSAPLPETPSGKLTRRDWMMFFLGVGSGLLAYALGRVLAHLFGHES